MQKLTAGKRTLGTAVPVGALWGKDSIGAGEFPDLVNFALLCKKMKIGLIQLLPVNDTGYESSPYSSLTAFGLHPLYLRIQDIDEYDESLVKKQMDEAKNKFAAAVRFSHYHILKAKLEMCRIIYAAHKGEILKKNSLLAWTKQNSWVKEYAVYRRLKEANGEKSWKDWPQYRDVSAADIETLWNDDALREDHFFWVWLQEALDSQFSKAAKTIAGEGIILKGDLPILMNEDSADVWANRNIFNLELSAGAPPDMYSPNGQNWGFPVYNWEEQEKDNYAWWRKRLEIAGKYYQAYRIDHVLGFFRIWASSRSDNSSALGRFIPYTPITIEDLKNSGFDKDRIRWLSRPHIHTQALENALRANWGGHFDDAAITAAMEKVCSKALDRIKTEEMWLFRDEIKGEKDIELLDLHPAAANFLLEAWRNRTLLEYGQGKFFPVWHYRDTQAYNSLSQAEKQNLEDLVKKLNEKSEKIWEAQGEKLLSIMAGASGMLPCAEDLGAVPACVPKTLARLKILGLRVTRWFRRWELEGQPYIPFDDYPELSVCTAAVHDSSTIREWWEKEADQAQFAGFIGCPALPKIYNPGAAKTILSKTAAAKSRFRVFQIQDLLHLSEKWYSKDPAGERVNIPGTNNDFNWTYRLPAPIEKIGEDEELIRAVAELDK